MTLTFLTWASFCIWLHRLSRASESKSEFCPTFFSCGETNPNYPPRDRHTNRHDEYLFSPHRDQQYTGTCRNPAHTPSLAHQKNQQSDDLPVQYCRTFQHAYSTTRLYIRYLQSGARFSLHRRRLHQFFSVPALFTNLIHHPLSDMPTHNITR